MSYDNPQRLVQSTDPVAGERLEQFADEPAPFAGRPDPNPITATTPADVIDAFLR